MARPNNAATECEIFTLMHMGNNKYALKGKNGRFLCVERSGKIVCNRKHIDGWERFQCEVEHNVPGQPWTVALRSHKKTFVSAAADGTTHAKSPQLQGTEKFMVTFIPDPQPLPILGQGRVAVSIRLQANGKYLCAEGASLFNMSMAGKLGFNRSVAKDWERFRLVHQGGNFYAIKNHHGKFITAESNGNVSARGVAISDCERWLVEWHPDGCTFRSFFGRYLGANMASKRCDAVNLAGMAGPSEKFFIAPH